MQLCLVSPKGSPGVVFGPARGGGGFTTFTCIYIEKTLEIPLYLAIRPRLAKCCMWLYVVGLYGHWLNYSPWVKFGPTPGVTSFTWTYKGKTLEISLYLAIKPRATKFCMYIVALSSGPSPRGVNYNPRVEMIAKGYKFYMGLYSEIFRNLLVAKHKNYGFQF